jgi:hypothetical protein
MISIIICSKQQDIAGKLKQNIEETIGVPYELIVIDNSQNNYSIFEAYNSGVKKSSCDFLCFMHEDIFYHSQDWGKSVIKHLSDIQTGLIGLAGSRYLLSIPSTWYKAKPYVKNQIQSDPEGNRPPKRYTIAKDEPVICVDGFWFCSRKDVFEQVAFDEESFHNFHFYDLDISMQIHEKSYSIYAVSDITVEHASGGTLNSQWLESAYIFYDKWKDKLPAGINAEYKVKTLSDVKAYRDLMYLHRKNNCPYNKNTTRLARHELGAKILIAYLLLLFKL